MDTANTEKPLDQIAAEAADKIFEPLPLSKEKAIPIILAAIEKALKTQADETKACIEMVGGLGAAHESMANIAVLQTSDKEWTWQEVESIIKSAIEEATLELAHELKATTTQLATERHAANRESCYYEKFMEHNKPRGALTHDGKRDAMTPLWEAEQPPATDDCDHQWSDYGTLTSGDSPKLEIESCVRCGVQRKKQPPATDDTWKHKIADFVNLILHGDDEHKAWLREAGEAFLFGKPIPPARGGAKKEPVVGLNHVTLRFPDCYGKPCKVIPTLSGNLQVGSAAAIVTSDEFEAIALLRIKALGQSPPATDDQPQRDPREDDPSLDRDFEIPRIEQPPATDDKPGITEWIPLSDGRGKCGVKDKEGWIARGLTGHQAMTISAAHIAAEEAIHLAHESAITELQQQLAAEREKREKELHELAIYLEGNCYSDPDFMVDSRALKAAVKLRAALAAEREKLKPLVEALEEIGAVKMRKGDAIWMRDTAIDALARHGESTAVKEDK